MGSTSLTNKKKKSKSKVTASAASVAKAPAESFSTPDPNHRPDISFFKLTPAQFSCLILLYMAISQTVEFRQLAHASLLSANNETSSSAASEQLSAWCGTNATRDDSTSSAACTLTDQIWIQLKSTSSTITTSLLGFVILFSGCWRNEDWMQQFRSLYCICPLGAIILLSQVAQNKPELVSIDGNKCWQMIMKTIVLLVLSSSAEGFGLLAKSTFRNLLFQPFSVARVVFLVASGLTLWEGYQYQSTQLGAGDWIPPEMAALRSQLATTSGPPAIFYLFIIDKLTQLMVFYFGFICLQRNDGDTTTQRSLIIGICLLSWLERYLTLDGLQQLFQSYSEEEDKGVIFSPSSMVQWQRQQATVLTALGVVAWFAPTVTFQKVKTAA